MFRTIATTPGRTTLSSLAKPGALGVLIAAAVAGAARTPALAGSDVPWTGLLVGLGLIGVAGLLGFLLAGGSFVRPLRRSTPASSSLSRR